MPEGPDERSATAAACGRIESTAETTARYGGLVEHPKRHRVTQKDRREKIERLGDVRDAHTCTDPYAASDLVRGQDAKTRQCTEVRNRGSGW